MKKTLNGHNVKLHLNGDRKENNKNTHNVNDLFNGTNYLSNFPKKKNNINETYLSRYQKKKKVKNLYNSENTSVKTFKNTEILNGKVVESERVKLTQNESVKSKEETKSYEKSYLSRFLEEKTKQEKETKEEVLKQMNPQKHKMNSKLLGVNLKFQKKWGIFYLKKI